MATNYLRVARLRTPDSTQKCRIYAHLGKRGYNVGVGMSEFTRIPGQKAKVGLQATFEGTPEGMAQAIARFEELVAGFTAKGWVLRTDIQPRRSSFSEIPVASGFVPEPSETPSEVVDDSGAVVDISKTRRSGSGRK